MRAFIIAEAGVNHNGDISLAKKLIDKALIAGVDAVKFQTWKTEILVSEDASQAEYQADNTEKIESQFDMLKRLELSYSDFLELKSYCDNVGIMFMSTPDEVESANFLKPLQSIFKIGSGELTNIPFLQHIAGFKRKVILSTGMGDLNEIQSALDALESGAIERSDITLLHATTMYPTPMKDVNLNAMQTMRDTFNTSVGYSDHTMGTEVSIAAVAMGASVIEKHFTLSRDMQGPDHKSSLEPEELRFLVSAIRNIEEALGDGVKLSKPSEEKNKNIVRKFIVAKQTIKKGDLYTEENLGTKRTGKGVSANIWKKVLGLQANNDYQIDEIIKL
jgi:N-acetylneuraminate synthase